MFTNRSVDRFAVTHKKDRSRWCAFTFADEHKCRHPLTHLESTPTRCKTKTNLNVSLESTPPKVYQNKDFNYL